MIHEILRMGDPRLLEVSQPVHDLDAPELRTLVDDMFETMHAATGAATARNARPRHGVVPRYSKIRYRGVDLQGRPIDRVVDGFHARVVQHECDHLDGILYPMRVRDFSRFGYTDILFPEMADAND